MFLENNSKILIIGDSITDCDRQRPVGEATWGLGNGYVNLINASLKATHPDKNYRIINMGISGNTVRDLKERWNEDVFNQNPDYVSIMIGINDVWRQYDTPLIKEYHVYIDEYKETLENLIKETINKVKGIILMTPYFIEPNKSDAMRVSMDEYGQVVRELAEKYNTKFIDMQAAFDRVLEYCHPMTLAGDRVHPNTSGHMIIANEWLKAVELK